MKHHELVEEARILAEQCKEYSENEYAICPHGTGGSVRVQDVIDYAAKAAALQEGDT